MANQYADSPMQLEFPLESNDDREHRPKGARRLGLVTGLLLSAGWLALFGAYLAAETGLENLRWMLPHEIGLLLAGVSGPLIVLWLVIHYVARGSELKLTALALQDELRKLTATDESGEARVRSLSDALRAQSRQFDEALQGQLRQLAEAADQSAAQMDAQIEKVQRALEHQRADLKDKAQASASELAEARQELRGQVDDLVGIAGEAAARAKSLRGTLSEHSVELARTSEKVSSQVSEIGDMLGDDASLLRWLSTRMGERARKVRDAVETEAPAADSTEPVRLHAQATGSGKPVGVGSK